MKFKDSSIYSTKNTTTIDYINHMNETQGQHTSYQLLLFNGKESFLNLFYVKLKAFPDFCKKAGTPIKKGFQLPIILHIPFFERL